MLICFSFALPLCFDFILSMAAISMRILLCLLLSLAISANAEQTGCTSLTQPSKNAVLSALIDGEKIVANYPTLAAVLKQQDRFKLQIIYTQIDRDQQNDPALTCYTLGLEPERYFYPASTVKLPISLLALEWLNEPQQQAITMFTPMLTDTAFAGQSTAHVDASSASGLPSIAHYIKKILLVSDNDASNRLYELLGQDRLNDRLRQLGLNHALINHRLSTPLTAAQNRQYNPIRFLNADGAIALALPARRSHIEYVNIDQPKLGSGYMADGVLIQQPMDFSNKNRLSLQDLDSIVKRVVFPQLFAANEQFQLTEEQRAFVLRYMSMLPGESKSPYYSKEQYPDNYAKFLMFGGAAQPLPAHIRIFNKTGWAYGHLVDSAYIVDLQNNVEFFLSAVIYTNENDILNDDRYETEQIGLPFLNQLGNYFYQLELKRGKNRKPDLSGLSAIINN
jgi:hypothetical protein